MVKPTRWPWGESHLFSLLSRKHLLLSLWQIWGFFLFQICLGFRKIFLHNSMRVRQASTADCLRVRELLVFVVSNFSLPMMQKHPYLLCSSTGTVFSMLCGHISLALTAGVSVPYPLVLWFCNLIWNNGVEWTCHLHWCSCVARRSVVSEMVYFFYFRN